MVDGTRDAIEVLVHDHREVEELFGEIEMLRDATDETSLQRRKELSQQVVVELVRHTVAEEVALYPAVKRALGDDELVEHGIDEHTAAEETMKRLEALDPGDPEFQRVFDDLVATIRHHVQEEEQELFPQLRERLSPDDLDKLGKQLQLVKKVAPTRPHPSAPDRPPWNWLLGPPTGLVDRARDLFTGRSGPEKS